MIKPTASFFLLKYTHAATQHFLLESFQVIFVPSLQEDGKILPMVPQLPALQQLLMEEGHVWVLGGGTPSDAGLPAFGLESKFSQAPAAPKYHTSPS